jgi:hypothetical protein
MSAQGYYQGGQAPQYPQQRYALSSHLRSIAFFCALPLNHIYASARKQIANFSFHSYGPPQGQYGQGPPMQYGAPPPQQQMYYGPPQGQQQYQQAPMPKQKKDRGCLGACLAALCCCFVCEEGCECCADCCECAEDCC